MGLRVVVLDILSGRRRILLNKSDAEKLGVALHDRVKISYKGKVTTAMVEMTGSLVSEGKTGLYQEVATDLQLSGGEEVDLTVAKTPSSVSFIREKVAGKRLTGSQITAVVDDVVQQNLSELEIAAFLLAQEFHGMTGDETADLAKAMMNTGTVLDFPGRVVDKHSIGGIPGNKVSLLIVPVIASAGLTIPKTSSRAITSPSGTVDTMSTLAEVRFTPEELKEIVGKVGGALVWGGSLGLAPADDIFVTVEQPLRIDPRPQMIASIIAKKAAVSADFVVLDIPVGRGAKVPDVQSGRTLGTEFIELGRKLGIQVTCGMTYGGQPVGKAVGPALEAREALMTLENPKSSSKSLVEKSMSLAGLLLEVTGVAARGVGMNVAREILESGKALVKFREIVEAQGGNPKVRSEELPVGSHVHKIISPYEGYVTVVDNDVITCVARAAGAPVEKGAGVILYAKQGYKVAKGDLLMEIYAERASKLSEAVTLAQARLPIVVEGMLLSTLPEM